MGQAHRGAVSAAWGAGVIAIAVAVSFASCNGSGSGASSGGSFGSAGGGFGGGVGSATSCASSASCTLGQTCCEGVGGGSPAGCQTGPCPTATTQLCAISEECLQPGYVCSPTDLAVPFGGTARGCVPGDGGSDAEASTGYASDGPLGDEPSPGDGSVSDVSQPSDAPAGDGASQGDGANDLDAGSSDAVDASLSDG